MVSSISSNGTSCIFASASSVDRIDAVVEALELRGLRRDQRHDAAHFGLQVGRRARLRYAGLGGRRRQHVTELALQQREQARMAVVLDGDGLDDRAAELG
jgi:hypothetical protein